MNMSGSLTVERLPTRPDWGISDTGRIIFDISTGNYWLGAHSSEVGSQGWVSLGLLSNSINSYHINWDTNISGQYGRVSAKDVPAKSKEKISNVQLILDDFNNQLDKLTEGSQILPKAIKDFHLDTTGENRISAEDIPVENTNGIFAGAKVTIEDALTQVMTRGANGILLDPAANFGSNLGFISSNVQQALLDLEQYLHKLNASRIPCTYEGCGCDTNVQFAIDALYHLHSNLRLTDLLDVPNYEVDKLFLKSNGTSKTEWVTIVANDVEAQYPSTVKSNVQAALWSIGLSLDSLGDRLDKLKYRAEDIEYTLANKPFLNVDDGLDYIFAHFYNPDKKPIASEIGCSGIGTPSNNNVQLALAYLNTNLNKIMSQMPCTTGADEVTYYSAQGATTVAHTLDYILGFINHVITSNNSISYPPFKP